MADTKTSILDAAERAFADRGFAATSLRAITSSAGVNLAAVHYHFGSKEGLIGAIFDRRLVPLNRERVELLERFERKAAGGVASVEQIVEAFVGPPLRMSHDPEGAEFVRLLGHALNQRDERIRELLTTRFGEVVRRFTASLSRALPDLPAADVFWRLLFMVGALAHTMALSDKLPALSGGLCDSSDVEGTIRRLVPFLAAGLRAPAHAEATR